MKGRRVGIWAGLVGFFSTSVLAQNSSDIPQSTWYLPKTETQFSLNIPHNSNDVYMYFASPAFSWVGVGFGESMANSLIFVMYQNKNGDNITISPRLGAHHVEPSFAPDIRLDILPGTTINDDSMMVLNAVCRDCRVWPKGSLDTTSKSQRMFYAFGPGDIMQSDSPSAGLRRHARYGHFTMDLTMATGNGGVPKNSTTSNGVVMVGDMARDRDRVGLAHTVIGFIALFFVWPLSTIAVGFFKNMRIHVVVSGGLLVFLGVSYVLGIVTSYQYNRSKNFTSSHQVLSFLSLPLLLLLTLLPLPKITALHPSLLSKIHTPLSYLTLFLLLITGGLGLALSSQTKQIILAYSAAALLAFVFHVTLATCIRKRGSASARAKKRAAGEDEDRMEMLKLEEMRRANQPGFAQGVGVGSNSGGPAAAGGQNIASGAPMPAQGANNMGPTGAPRPGHVQTQVVGGGAMPGPQYLLNMHPGVPVNRW